MKMKKILIFLNTIILASFLLGSCNPNKYATFDDADAFVAFDISKTSVKENAGFVEIPVTLASVAGVSTTISCTTTDGTAKKGIDYQIEGDGTLTFDSQNRTQKLKIRIIDRPGLYTGDLTFTVGLSSTGSVNSGAANTCDITISDLDHPLSPILGTYTATGAHPVNGPVTWQMELRKDATDVSKVWFYNIANLGNWVGDDIMYYGIVDKDLTTITIPIGQESEYKYSNGNAVTLFGIDANSDSIEEGNIIVSIQENGHKLSFPDSGVWCYIIDAGTISVVGPGIICNKD